MNIKTPLLMIAALFVLLPSVAFAQPAVLPPAPVAVQPLQPPAPPPGLPPLPAPTIPNDNWLQTPTPLPPPQGLLPVVPPAPSTGLADPGPNGWGPLGPASAVPTFFVGLELDVSKPVFKDHLTGTVTFPNGATDTLHVPQTPLDWTGSPRFELGYVLPDSFGEFVLGYRFYATDGTGVLGSNLGDFDVRSRLNMNIIDFDYNSARYSPWPRWDMTWTLGARIATVFYDTSIDDGLLSQSASNYFYGGGGHAALELDRQFGILPSISFFAKGDASILLGEVTQHYNESFIDAAGNVISGNGYEERKTQSVPVLNFRAGVNYQPPNLPYLHFSLGYEFEHWFSLGRAGDSNAELTTQGVFFRGQLDF
jgi:Legionella pneumophila major outer membrane protein precursor